jgi:YidC/Oxa1 family membrane protein insertase
MTDPGIFNQILIWPILNILIAFYKLFLALALPGAFGLAIIALTVSFRLLLSPLIGSQLKSAQKMQELKPRLDELSQKYGKDKARLQQEQLRLYKEAGVNPAAGCLPLILQMPIFIALYNVFWQILGNGNLEKVVQDINQIVYFPFLRLQNLDLSFLGINLATKPSSWNTAGWWLLTIPLATAILQWYQTKLMTVTPQQTTNNKQQTGDDMAKIMQTQMTYLFPLMIGWFAFSFPVGLSLYWNTFTVLGIIQQMKIRNSKSKIRNNNGKY